MKMQAGMKKEAEKKRERLKCTVVSTCRRPGGFSINIYATEVLFTRPRNKVNLGHTGIIVSGLCCVCDTRITT